MSMHATIDPAKAVRWERQLAVGRLVRRLGLAALFLAAAWLGSAVLNEADLTRTKVTGEVTGVPSGTPGADTASTVRYVDGRGAVHVKRINVGASKLGDSVPLIVPADDPGAAVLADTLVESIRSKVPVALFVVAVIPLLSVPSLVIRLAQVGRARKVLGLVPLAAGFDWFRKQDGRRKVSCARLAPKENLWDDRTIVLGTDRLDLDATVTHEVEVWGEPRGTEPMIVVGSSWTYVVIR